MGATVALEATGAPRVLSCDASGTVTVRHSVSTWRRERVVGGRARYAAALG